MRVCFLEGRTGEEKKNTFYFNKFCFHTLKRGESGKVELSFPPSPLPLFNLDGIKIRLKPARVGKKEGGFLLGASVWLAGSGGFLNMRNKPNKQPYYCFPPFFSLLLLSLRGTKWIGVEGGGGGNVMELWTWAVVGRSGGGSKGLWGGYGGGGGPLLCATHCVWAAGNSPTFR